jgi:acetyl-CoA carboxylase biotin carboxylase subunit
VDTEAQSRRPQGLSSASPVSSVVESEVIKRLLIANRGEIALRIIRSCRELGIESIAVYSAADAPSPYVAAADRAVAIGGAPASESYLSIPRLIQAAQSAGADAVHPGYGFLAENARFAEACAGAGLIFVGPPAAAIARMGSKIDARRLVAAAGVPLVPGETPQDQSDRGIEAAIDRVGLPALVKASAGGGGKGMRRVRTPEERIEAIEAARREAHAAFGDGTLYVEKLIEKPRHVEVQIFADHHGQVIHLFERECSVQRRHQKVIEESPSPALTADLRARMTAAAITATRAVEYQNAGTIEFLVDGSSFYFLEMNTRLQVEHPVTEQVTGLDLVRAQLLVASGEPLPWTQAHITQRGHAIEARVYAEDPAHEFLPQAGRLSVFRAPHLPGVRVDSGVAEGSEISVYYDPMIAKVIATAESRPLAINRLAAALRAFQIEGVRTNVPFLIRILELPEFRDGKVDTGFLDREGATLASEDPVVVSARPPSSASNVPTDPWDAGTPIPRGLPTDPSGVARSAKTEARPMAPRAKVGRRPASPKLGGGGPSKGGSPAGTEVAGGAVTAPMPATVIRINVKPGDAVKKGDILVLLEAMKMELPVRASGGGTVRAIRCREGELVDADAVLLELQ